MRPTICWNAGMSQPNRIRELRQQAKLTMDQLAERVGTSNQQISKLELGKAKLTVEWMRRLAPALGCAPVDLMMEKGTALEPHPHRLHLVNPATPNAPPVNEPNLGATIPEIDVYGGMGGGGEALIHWEPDGNGNNISRDEISGHWSLPPDYLRSELHVKAQSTRIIQVKGDSMEPLLQTGDRVMIDLSDKAPSPPGIFALWDGLGVVVKRLELIMGSEPPTLEVKSDNPKHRTYERSADEVSIIGRVVWFARRL